MITILTYVVRLLSAEDGRESGGGVECKLYIITIIQFSDFTWYSVVYISLQNQYIAKLHSSIGTGIDYWVLVSLEANIIGYWVPCLVSF